MFQSTRTLTTSPRALSWSSWPSRYRCLNRAESVGPSVDRAVFAYNPPFPRSRNELEWSNPQVGSSFSFYPTEKLERLPDRSPGGRSLEADRLENLGEKVSNAAVAVDDLFVAAFIGRASERFGLPHQADERR